MTSHSATLSWGAPSSDTGSSSGYKYKVVRAASSSEIDTTTSADAITGSHLLMDWTSDITTVNVAGLFNMNTYSFAVLVKDETGNLALYSPVQLTTTPPLARLAKSVTSGTHNSIYNSALVASDGSIYAVGSIQDTGTFAFGNGVTAAGGPNTHLHTLIIKYDSSGNAVWAKSNTCSGGGHSSFNGVSIDSDGNIYAVGNIQSTHTFGFGNSVSVVGTGSNYNVVIVKYNSSGDAQWAKSIASLGNSSDFLGVSVSSDGGIYAVGTIAPPQSYGFGNSVTLGAASCASGTCGILVKYNVSGSPQWVKTISGGPSSFKGVSITSDGSSIYTVGFINPTGGATHGFGNSVTASGTYGGNNIVLAKYNSSGTAQWAKTTSSGNNTSLFNSVSHSSDGSIYAVGYITNLDTYGFGNNVTATGSYASGTNAVIVKYDSTGAAQWAQSPTSGSNTSEFSGASVSTDGSIYTVGTINQSGTYGFGNSVTATGSYASGTNAVIIKYDPTGSAQWAQSTSSGSNISAYKGVFVSSDGSIHTVGSIAGSGTSYGLGNDVATSGTYAGTNSIFVKYQ